jgi:hypothetical protein
MTRGKVESAVSLIRRHVAAATRPIVMSSFGKDSMVLLALVKMAGLKLPVLFFKEPFFPSKYAFANAIIAQEGYTVYDYPPAETAVVKRGETFEVVNYHQAGEQVIYLPTGVSSPQCDEPFLCGLNDLYLKPTCGQYDFPWDLLLIGHKSSDVDPILGPVPLQSKVKLGRPTCVFPLEDWTDEDIWRFTELAGLAVNTRRYDPERGYAERPDLRFNPDYFPACVACIDPTRSPRVYCPKVNEMVTNVSAQVRQVPAVRPSYMEPLMEPLNA